MVKDYDRTFEHQFILFSRLHKTISYNQIYHWLNQAKLFTRKLTPEDSESVYKKFDLDRIECETLQQFLTDLSTERKVKISEIKSKLVSCGLPDSVKMNRPVYARSFYEGGKRKLTFSAQATPTA